MTGSAVCFKVRGNALPAIPKIVSLTGLSNREFLEAYAQPGRVGLAGGADLISRAIEFAQRHVPGTEGGSRWSHAFLFHGRRLDGEHWVIESDLEIHRKHIRLGVQENRATKFHDDKAYPQLAIIDFGLSPTIETALLREALEMVASRVRYSLRELMGTLVGLRHPTLRTKGNLLARDGSLFCSAFVHHLFRRAGLDLAPGLDIKHTTPEDVFRSPAATTIWLLERERVPSKLRRIAAAGRAKVRARLKPPKRQP